MLAARSGICGWLTGKPSALIFGRPRRLPFRVYREVFPGGHRAGGDEGHDAHAHFGDHRAVANDADITFVPSILGVVPDAMSA